MSAEIVQFVPRPNPQREKAIVSALAEIVKRELASPEMPCDVAPFQAPDEDPA